MEEKFSNSVKKGKTKSLTINIETEKYALIIVNSSNKIFDNG